MAPSRSQQRAPRYAACQPESLRRTRPGERLVSKGRAVTLGSLWSSVGKLSPHPRFALTVMLAEFARVCALA